MKSVLAFLVLVGCSSAEKNTGCELPPLGENRIKEIADVYLKTKKLNPDFRAVSQSRVKSVGCLYHYEERESFDRFGLGIVVEIDREGRIVDSWDLY